MHQPLDLAVMLSPPPSGCPSNVLANMTLSCEALKLKHVDDLLIFSLTKDERKLLRWYLDDYSERPYEEFIQRAKRAEALFPQIGKRLYEAVFGNPKAKDLVERWDQDTVPQHQISIIGSMPEVLSLPWEFLHDERGFLALHVHPSISIVRRLLPGEVVAEAEALPLKSPLRILLITARPTDQKFVDHRSIASELLNAMQEQIEADSIELEFLRPPTLSQLKARLREVERPIHVLHFDGHGRFNEKKDRQGMLVFEDDQYHSDLISAEILAQSLRESGVQFVMLTACQSAVVTVDDTFSSIAAHLIQGGINTVVAMSAGMLVVSAARYVGVFYRALATGIPLSIAQGQARRVLYDDPSPIGYEEGKVVGLCDWSVLLLPRFVQLGQEGANIGISHKGFSPY